MQTESVRVGLYRRPASRDWLMWLLALGVLVAFGRVAAKGLLNKLGTFWYFNILHRQGFDMGIVLDWALATSLFLILASILGALVRQLIWVEKPLPRRKRATLIAGLLLLFGGGVSTFAPVGAHYRVDADFDLRGQWRGTESAVVQCGTPLGFKLLHSHDQFGEGHMNEKAGASMRCSLRTGQRLWVAGSLVLVGLLTTGLGLRGIPQNSPTPITKAGRQKRWLVGIGIASVLLVIGVAVAWEMSGGFRPPAPQSIPPTKVVGARILELRPIAGSEFDFDRFEQILGPRYRGISRAGVAELDGDDRTVTVIYEYGPCGNPGRPPKSVSVSYETAAVTVVIDTSLPPGFCTLEGGSKLMKILLDQPVGGRKLEAKNKKLDDAKTLPDDREYQELQAKEFFFEQCPRPRCQRPPHYDFAANATASFRIRNLGSVIHNFSIRSLDSGQILALEDIEGGASVNDVDIAPGGTRRVAIAFPPGKYEYFCKYHADKGMRADFRAI